MHIDLDIETDKTLLEFKITKNNPYVRGGPWWVRIWVNDSLSFGHSMCKNASGGLDSAIIELKKISKQMKKLEKKREKQKLKEEVK